MENKLHQLQKEAQESLTAAADAAELEEFRIKFLGRKGAFTAVMRSLGSVPIEERPRLGQLANGIKSELTALFEQRLSALTEESASGDGEIDCSLPGRIPQRGSIHPVTQIMEEVCNIFASMGFSVEEGAEVEETYYNFDALNIPAHHPARDMHDTFYISDSILLRTHTSPMQARVMEKQQPPVRMIAPGKVFRSDSDITHTPMFHQVEGLMVDREISFADLKGVLTVFIREIFQEELAIRFRPSFFPFTEPSAEVDIACVMCGGDGCRVCKKTGWLEILGSGMVNPRVLEMAGYDSQIYSGFAFGLGVERIAMLKFGIGDIRLYYENDLRFLSQFA